MAAISIAVAVGEILAVLREAFEGPSPSWGYFTDHGPEAGLLGTLAKLSAAEASRPAGGTSIAAHVYHVIFGLEVSFASVQGDHAPRDWRESWRVSTVTEKDWSRLQEDLREKYDELRQAISSHASASAPCLGEAIGAVAHVAYHLGAVRQKVANARLG